MKKDKKKVYIFTMGCAMNEYDTELVKAILEKEQYAFVKDEKEADIVMLNTCAIREHAHRKVYGRIHHIKHKRKGNPVMIGVLGCMATNLRTELLENEKLDIDFIAGPDSYKRLPQLIQQAKTENSKAFDVTLSEFETYSDVYPTRQEGINAWIACMRGCNNFCTFCVVPYTRGRERSRSIENVVEEAKRLADEGFKQVTLLGQNVNSYKHESHDFADLLEAVSRVNGIERIRFTSPHPKDFPDKVLDVIASNPKVCNSIHMPLQAGNIRILKLMERNYTREEFIDLTAKAREKIPGVTISTDIIVGFCSETDEEFEDTYKTMKEVEFDAAFIFKYSQRKNTIASKNHPDDVSDEKKTERIVRLNDLQKDIALKLNEASIGKTENVLIEAEKSSKSDLHSFGRTDGNKVVIIPANGYTLGNFVDVKITEASPHALRGEAI